MTGRDRVAGAARREADGGGPPRAPRSALVLSLIGVGFAILIVGFGALGVWQVHRLSWKLDLIARVNARVHAAPVPAPGPADWAKLSRKTASYRHVRVTGHFQPDVTRVLASTVHGRGFWLLSPLKSPRGFTVLVNRGFVPEDQAETQAVIRPPSGAVGISGLLRMTEPGGAFLRSNAPSANRWYSRDVAAIAKAHHLGTIAPYFIDADANSDPRDRAIGGLTVIHFRNAHLSYAITWFALALLSVGCAVILYRYEWRLRQEETR